MPQQSDNAVTSKTSEAMMAKPYDPAMANTEEAMMAKPYDPAMAAEAKLLVKGQFHRVRHKGLGTASIFQFADTRAQATLSLTCRCGC